MQQGQKKLIREIRQSQQPTFKGASSWPGSTGITIPRRRRTDW